MSLIQLLRAKLLPLLEDRVPARCRKPPPRPRRIAIQLEFPWTLKR